MSTDLPMVEIRRRLSSWVDFLAPLSEEQLDALVVRRASFVRLEKGEVLVVGPEEHGERMLLVVAGQLQVYEISLGSGREHTLSRFSPAALRSGPRGWWPAGRETCT